MNEAMDLRLWHLVKPNIHTPYEQKESYRQTSEGLARTEVKVLPKMPTMHHTKVTITQQANHRLANESSLSKQVERTRTHKHNAHVLPGGVIMMFFVEFGGN